MNKFKIVFFTTIIITLIQILIFINFKQNILDALQQDSQSVVFNDTGSVRLSAENIPDSISKSHKNELFILTYEINVDRIDYSIKYNGDKECSIYIPFIGLQDNSFVTFKPKDIFLTSKTKNKLKLIKLIPYICFKNDLNNIDILPLKPIIIPQ